MHTDPTDLFRRHPANPILTAAQWPYPVNAVFNPAATRLADGRTLLLVRCETHDGTSHLTKAISIDGSSDWAIGPEPTFVPHPDHPEEQWGVEDARITWMPELAQHAVAYTAYGPTGPGVGLALTSNFVTFDRKGLVLPPADKDAALFPTRIGGRFAILHRPYSATEADMWISYSDDLTTWEGRSPVMRARNGGFWDANKIGLSPPPIPTPEGWLVIYHGVRTTAGGCLYRCGLALLDLEDPSKVIRRGKAWVMGPKDDYERMGDVPNVVFPCGWTLSDDADGLNLYYGGADTVVGLASGRVREILDWLRDSPNC